MKAKLRELIGGEVDEYTVYEGIEKVKEHKVVNHGKREWARGEAHVNGSENRNGFLRTYLSRHRGVSKNYLPWVHAKREGEMVWFLPFRRFADMSNTNHGLRCRKL